MRHFGLLCCAALTLISPAAATASRAQESIFQDDDLLLYNTPAGTTRTLDTLAGLGVQRLRISVFWRLVAPAPLSRHRPKFDASNPAAYPNGAWDRYDRVVTEAAKRGLTVNFDITSPAPLWATGRPNRADIAPTFEPSPGEFRAFVTAVGRRYSGSFTPLAATASAARAQPDLRFDQAPNPIGGLLGMLLPPNPNGSGSNPAPQPPSQPPPTKPGQALARVDDWSIWNEPNQPGWLTPQWTPSGVEAAPALYRRLLDAGYAALVATGHRSDTILVGETAPKGLNVKGQTRAIKPLPFVRALYCLDRAYRPLRGRAATARGCPAGGRGFAAAHPVLFAATGWAHHPYELTFAPNRAPRDPNNTTIANIGRLSSTLRAVRRAYHRAGELPVYMTEFGYMSNPPSPIGVSLDRQAAYLNQAEFIAYGNSAVRSFDQFLLVDSPPVPGRGRHSSKVAAFGAAFQTGLMFRDGRRKPSFAAYRLPVFLPQPVIRRGGLLRVWGLVRPATSPGSQRVAIQFRSGGGAFTTILTTTTRPRPAYLDTHVTIPGSGQLRLAWTDPVSHETIYSRTVSAVVR